MKHFITHPEFDELIAQMAEKIMLAYTFTGASTQVYAVPRGGVLVGYALSKYI